MTTHKATLQTRRGYSTRAWYRCACGQVFLAVRHPVILDRYESPDLTAHLNEQREDR